MTYCPKCGNKYVLLDGTPCDCRMSPEIFTADTVEIDIPEQYQGIAFRKELVAEDMSEGYAPFLYKLVEDITTFRLKNKNILLCSPKARSKTIMAYTAINVLFKQGIPVFPIYDLLELRKMTVDVDTGKTGKYDQKQIDLMLNCPYLFVKLPEVLVIETFAMLALVIDRRTRRNGSTIIIYDGDLENMKKFDYRHVIDNMSGDGSFGTIKCYNFFKKEET